MEAKLSTESLPQPWLGGREAGVGGLSPVERSCRGCKCSLPLPHPIFTPKKNQAGGVCKKL